MTPDDPRHGTANGYSNLKCRCAKCTNAWRLYLRGARWEQRRRRGLSRLEAYREYGWDWLDEALEMVRSAPNPFAHRDA